MTKRVVAFISFILALLAVVITITYSPAKHLSMAVIDINNNQIATINLTIPSTFKLAYAGSGIGSPYAKYEPTNVDVKPSGLTMTDTGKAVLSILQNPDRRSGSVYGWIGSSEIKLINHRDGVTCSLFIYEHKKSTWKFINHDSRLKNDIQRGDLEHQ